MIANNVTFRIDNFDAVQAANLPFSEYVKKEMPENAIPIVGDLIALEVANEKFTLFNVASRTHIFSIDNGYYLEFGINLIPESA